MATAAHGGARAKTPISPTTPSQPASGLSGAKNRSPKQGKFTKTTAVLPSAQKARSGVRSSGTVKYHVVAPIKPTTSPQGVITKHATTKKDELDSGISDLDGPVTATKKLGLNDSVSHLNSDSGLSPDCSDCESLKSPTSRIASMGKQVRLQTDIDKADTSKGAESPTTTSSGKSLTGPSASLEAEAPVKGLPATGMPTIFEQECVEAQVEEVLIARLKDLPYEPQRCKQLSQELAATVMDRLKRLKLRNYKLVAVVSVGSVKERPGMQFGSRCLWNQNTDCFTSVKYTNGSLFAVALVYALHF